MCILSGTEEMFFAYGSKFPPPSRPPTHMLVGTCTLLICHTRGTIGGIPHSVECNQGREILMELVPELVTVHRTNKTK